MARKALKPIKYDTIIRGTNDYIPVSFSRKDSEGNITPYDLTGKLLVLTAKSKEYDGEDGSERELSDDSAATSQISDNYDFKITIDCDDETEGSSGPEDSSNIWKNNYQGMYGQDPKEGKAVFRLTKKMTMIKPGDYYFDIRIMDKSKSTIGQISECKDWCPVLGTFTIQGTPTNRTAAYDWENN